jgi:hypothetical protein
MLMGPITVAAKSSISNNKLPAKFDVAPVAVIRLPFNVSSTANAAADSAGAMVNSVRESSAEVANAVGSGTRVGNESTLQAVNKAMAIKSKNRVDFFMPQLYENWA